MEFKGDVFLLASNEAGAVSALEKPLAGQDHRCPDSLDRRDLR